LFIMGKANIRPESGRYFSVKGVFTFEKETNVVVSWFSGYRDDANRL
jgi:hypothetical protein